MFFILAQICGVISFILIVISMQFKTKEKIAMCSALSNLTIAIQFFLLNALTGAIISVVNAIRSLIYYLYKKNNKNPSIAVFLVFETLVIILGIISWQNIWSIIPIIATMIYTYGLWQDDVKVIRITAAIAGGGWTIYNLVFMAYAGAVQQISQLTSAVVALYKNKETKK